MEMENTNSNLNIRKQDLLKREIIDKNIDKDAFLDYCTSQKENGDDLDLWSFEELEETIKKFLENYSSLNNSNIETKHNQKKKKVIKKEINEDDNLTSQEPQEPDDQTEKYAVN